jgi:periplasmic divalent cation tolerance protein
VVVYVTAPSAEVADSLATALVQSQLVACVNIVPGLTSVYTWKVGVAGQLDFFADVQTV